MSSTSTTLGGQSEPVPNYQDIFLENAMMEDHSMQNFPTHTMPEFTIPQYMGFSRNAGGSNQQSSMEDSRQPSDAPSMNMSPTFENTMRPASTSGGGDLSMIQGMKTVSPVMMPTLQSFVSHDTAMDTLDTTQMVPTSPQPSLAMQNAIAAIPQGPTSEIEQKNIRIDNVYSTSGFDMIGLLMKVATRPDPQINIGAVDMSCAFVVCDAKKYDTPIVYCSATFERLTGFSKHEILGRNCRFLQSPTGIVEKGAKRKYVDGDTVRYLKMQCDARKESQTSLINYRKGGQPFMNLLTTIPVSWDSNEIAYFVGFQVDLVDQPGSIMNRNMDGSIVINYQQRQLPTHFLPRLENRVQASGATVSNHDVAQLLTSAGTADSELARRLWDKVLLENTDDVVHVLSLKGLFLYCSPSAQKVLEYDPSDLVGTAISTVCHPSDIVPVTRDLKDTSTNAFVNVVFRIRRKFSGYMWFESFGCLHTEQGKGRKCIILVGRERPVYKLKWKEIHATGGIGDHEVWSKISPSGMFLYISSHVRSLLDREPDDLIGQSFQTLMRQESRMELMRAIETARQGKQSSVRHEIQNKRGQFLQALTVLYPGDGKDDKKTTFLICQTKLLKHSRGSGSSKSSNAGDAKGGSVSSTPVWSPQGRATPDEKAADGDNDNPEKDKTEENVFEELKTTRGSSWQFELRQMQRTNKRLAEDLSNLLALRKKRKRRKGADTSEKDCANCHTRTTPEWRRGPSGKRDLCNSCGLRYAKLVGRVSPRITGNAKSDQGDTSPQHHQTTSPSPLSNQSLVNTDLSPAVNAS